LWEEFSRLGGGIGTRGPGEQKLEIDRRRISSRIAKLKKDLERLRAHRSLLRQSRARKNFQILVIVGYTNAGKSQLLNTMSGASVLVQDKLFATLDPTTRKVELPGKKSVLVTDTVGFIENLPQHLMQAFKATLEEIHMADLILHVLDVSDPKYKKHEEIVRKVLAELGVDFTKVQTVLNKIDLLPEAEEIRRLQGSYPDAILVSAKTQQGVDRLRDEIVKYLTHHEN
jgi:GTP-binding protein HflX